MNLLLFLAADYANISREGKINVMGIFNDINAPGFPTRISSMNLIAKLRADLGEYGQNRNFTTRLMDEDGNTLVEVSGEFRTPQGGRGRKPEVNIILNLKDIVFPKPGTYAFVFLIDKDQKGDLTLYVNQVEEAKPAKE